MMTRSH